MVSRSIFIFSAISSVALYVAPAAPFTSAAAQTVHPYCVENRTGQTIQTHHQGDNRFIDIKPGYHSCCTSRCNGKVTAGVSFQDERDLATKTQIALAVAAKLAGLIVPPGQPVSQGPAILPFCRLDPDHGDTIQVFRTGRKHGAATLSPLNGTQVSYSLDRKGQVETPWSYINACNRAGDGTAYVAFAYLENGRWIAEGWRAVDEGECSRLYLPRGYRNYAYVYANTDRLTWDGEWNMCVHPNNVFHIVDADVGACGGQNREFGFLELNVNGEVHYFNMGPSQ